MLIGSDFNAEARMLDGLQLEIEAGRGYDDLDIQLEAIHDRLFFAMKGLLFDESEVRGRPRLLRHWPDRNNPQAAPVSNASSTSCCANHSLSMSSNSRFSCPSCLRSSANSSPALWV